MHRSRIVAMIAAGLAALALVAAQGPAEEETSDCRLIRGEDTPDDTSDDVEVCEQQVWFHRADTPVGNLAGSGSVTGGDDLDDLPSWDTNPPADSYQEGAGGGYATVRLADILEPRNEAYRPTFEGTFTGDLDTLLVDLYLTSPIYARTGNDFPLFYTVEVDGVPIVDRSGEELGVPMEATSNNGVSNITFAVTDLYKVMESFGDFFDTGPDAEHTVRVTFINRYWGDGNSVIFYDTTEVPSNMTFNVDADTLPFGVPRDSATG